MDDRRLEALVDKLCNEQLTATESEELADALRSSETLAAKVSEQLWLHRVLGELRRPAFEMERLLESLPAKSGGTEAIMRQVQRAPVPVVKQVRGRWRRVLGWGAPFGLVAAAAGVLVVVLGQSPRDRAGAGAGAGGGSSSRPATAGRTEPRAFGAFPEGPQGTPADPAAPSPRLYAAPLLRSIGGNVRVLEPGGQRPLRAGDELPLGPEIYTTAGESRATIALGDSAEVRMNFNTRVAFSGVARGAGAPPEALITQGRLVAHVTANRARPLVLASPHAVVESRQGSLSMRSWSDFTVVHVSAGAASVRAIYDQEPIELGAGQQALIERKRGVTLMDAVAPGETVVATSSESRRLRQRLERLGHRVRVIDPDHLNAEAARQAAFVVLGPTVQPQQIDPSLRDLAVPMLVSDPNLFSTLAMVERTEFADRGQTEATSFGIKDRTHPLAAGLQGLVKVTSARAPIGWGTPGPLAIWIGVMSDDPTAAAIFAYERGVRMPMREAPARRVGFFLDASTIAQLEPAGWALFDAAVRWCVAEPASR